MTDTYNADLSAAGNSESASTGLGEVTSIDSEPTSNSDETVFESSEDFVS
jgi:hypothetical protein